MKIEAKTPFKRDFEIKLGQKLKRRRDLRLRLIEEGQTRWLDVGCGFHLEPEFFYLDWASPPDISEEERSKFFQASILDLADEDFSRIGSYDLVRMQHVFEHFSFEEGLRVLLNCARMLNAGGYLLITVPDLDQFIRSYRKAKFPRDFSQFAQERVPSDAPASCYFSIYAHSFGYVSDERREFRDQHKWCYDYEGLEYQVKRAGKYCNIQRLGLLNPLSSIPFTHNRPAEDVCLLAQKL